MMRDLQIYLDKDYGKVMDQVLTEQRSRFHPNTVFLADTRVLMKSNLFGLRGSQIDSGHGLVVIWGDSLVFGGWDGETWIQTLADSMPTYNIQNGGIPGDHISNTLKRAHDLNRWVVADLNVVVSGWHRSSPHYGPEIEGYVDLLEEYADKIPNLALATTPTALNASSLHQIDVNLIYDTKGTGFHNELSMVELQNWYGRILVKNEVVREFGKRRGIPVLDWFMMMRTANLDEVRTDFYDRYHIRKSASPKVAKMWADWISLHLAERC